MKSRYDWSNYNKKRNIEAIKIDKYNSKKIIHYFEKGIYNHIRDIYALSLLLAKGKTNTQVLDYGGNLISHCNLLNKINTKKISFLIYNPYINNINKKLNFKYKLSNNISDIKNKKFNLIYFGSSLQYISDINSLIESKIISKCNYVLITHTPLSFKEQKVVKKLRQSNHKELFQNIYSYKFIYQKLLNKKFELIFKSINHQKYSGINKKYKNIFSVNLLFKKK